MICASGTPSEVSRGWDRIQKLTNDRSKFNFTSRYLHGMGQRSRNQIMQPEQCIVTTCIHLRRSIVAVGKAIEELRGRTQ